MGEAARFGEAQTSIPHRTGSPGSRSGSAEFGRGRSIGMAQNAAHRACGAARAGLTLGQSLSATRVDVSPKVGFSDTLA